VGSNPTPPAVVQLKDAEDWIRAHVRPAGPIETTHERPWSTVRRVPTTDGIVWFKACAPVQSFEPRLTAELAARWPDRVTEVIAHDEARAWLLLVDAGTNIGDAGNRPESWQIVLRPYAELQRGEAANAADHVAHGVPDLRPAAMPERYEDLLRHELPIEADEVERLRAFAPRFALLCEELEAGGIPASVQHDDLHGWNVYERDGRLRVVDWGDSSISHPFLSLVVTFRFLEENNGLAPTDPWYARLRDAYLEPWGSGQVERFDLAIRVGAFVHAIAWVRQRDHLPEEARPAFDEVFPIVLRRAVARTHG
jgi:hypothetical protein